MSHIEVLEAACNLARDLEKYVEVLRPLVQRCHRNRHIGDVYFNNNCLDCTIEDICNIARDLSVDLEFSNAIGGNNTLNSHVSLARDLGRALAHAHGLATANLVDDTRHYQSSNGVGWREGSPPLSLISRIAHTRRLKHEISHIGSFALTIAATVAYLRGRPLDPGFQSEVDRLLAVFVSHEPEDIQEERLEIPLRPTQRASRSALKLSNLAARLLPHYARARYTEEWEAELMTLAEDGSRRAQVSLSLKLLSRSISLRIALAWEPSPQRKRPQ